MSGAVACSECDGTELVCAPCDSAPQRARCMPCPTCRARSFGPRDGRGSRVLTGREPCRLCGMSFGEPADELLDDEEAECLICGTMNGHPD